MPARPRFKKKGPRLWSLEFFGGGEPGEWIKCSRPHYHDKEDAEKACAEFNRQGVWPHRVVPRHIPATKRKKPIWRRR